VKFLDGAVGANAGREKGILDQLTSQDAEDACHPAQKGVGSARAQHCRL